MDFRRGSSISVLAGPPSFFSFPFSFSFFFVLSGVIGERNKGVPGEERQVTSFPPSFFSPPETERTDCRGFPPFFLPPPLSPPLPCSRDGAIRGERLWPLRSASASRILLFLFLSIVGEELRLRRTARCIFFSFFFLFLPSSSSQG